jgi:hypothetical protein
MRSCCMPVQPMLPNPTRPHYPAPWPAPPPLLGPSIAHPARQHGWAPSTSCRSPPGSPPSSRRGSRPPLIFSQMKKLQPSLPEYAAYTGEHWKIAGGMVANKVFVIVDYVQLSCAILAILTLGLTLLAANQAVPKYRPPLAGVRILFLSIACALFCYQLFILAPPMAVHLNDFWVAAKDGKMAIADAEQAAFDADHPTASNVLKGHGRHDLPPAHHLHDRRDAPARGRMKPAKRPAKSPAATPAQRSRALAPRLTPCASTIPTRTANSPLAAHTNCSSPRSSPHRQPTSPSTRSRPHSSRHFPRRRPSPRPRPTRSSPTSAPSASSATRPSPSTPR